MNTTISLNKRILNLTVPNIVTNITVPLLGMVDIAIIGHLDKGAYIGAIAIGSAIFNLIYWNFGFLRMGTTGWAAQAFGARNFKECADSLVRSSAIGLIIGLLFIALQILLFWGAEYVMNISDTMLPKVKEYFYIRIWAAPATLALYAVKGWFLGMQNSKLPMYMAIIINVVNILVSYLLAYSFGLGMSGVAIGTVAAQYSGLLLGLYFVYRYYSRIIKGKVSFGSIFHTGTMGRYFKVNSDIMLRSTCLVVVFTFFTSISSKMGDDILNANTLLMQLFTLFSYIMDGFAYAGESLTGRFYGASNWSTLKRVIKYLFFWSVGITIIFALLYTVGLKYILLLFTDNTQLIEFTMSYKLWIVAVPIFGFIAFLYDGIAGGMLKTTLLRNSIFIATIVFFILYYSLESSLHNMALWIAFLSFLLLRGVFLLVPIHKWLQRK